MTRQLSPAAQAVLDAVRIHWEEWPVTEQRWRIACSIRATIDQVVPPSLEAEFYDRNPSLTLQKAIEIRSELLAIADELEGL